MSCGGDMKKLIVILLSACVLHSSFAFADERYLCITDSSCGFSFNKSSGNWEHVFFKANSKYIISKPEAGTLYERAAFVVHRVGESVPCAVCMDGFDEYGYLSCSDGGFLANRTNGRFIYASVFGYVNVLPEVNGITDETSDTPWIEIGKCSPF
jgi:hypothetical protein